MTREHQALIDFERMIVFAVVTLKSVLAVDALLGADKAEVGIAKRNAVVGVPSPQHRARHFAGHAADRGTAPDPARRRVADPGLAIGLVHVFDADAADPVGEIMILRGGDRRRQVAEAEFLQPGQKPFLLLTAKNPEYEFRGGGRAAPGHDHEDQAGEIGMIEAGDGSPSQPLRVARVIRHFGLGHPQIPVSAGLCPRLSIHANFIAEAANISRFSLLYRDMRGARMRKEILRAICVGALVLPLVACSEQDTSTAEQTFGPSPTLPAPQHSWIPTANVATATGWPAGGKPAAANGMAVNAFASGLDHPRTVYVLPNGDVLGAETNATPKPERSSGRMG